MTFWANFTLPARLFVTRGKLASANFHPCKAIKVQLMNVSTNICHWSISCIHSETCLYVEVRFTVVYKENMQWSPKSYGFGLSQQNLGYVQCC